MIKVRIGLGAGQGGDVLFRPVRMGDKRPWVSALVQFVEWGKDELMARDVSEGPTRPVAGRGRLIS